MVNLMLLPLQGALFGPRLPRVSFATLTLPWAMVLLGLQPVLGRQSTPQGAVRYAHSALGYGLVGLSGRSWPLIPPIVPTLQAGF